MPSDSISLVCGGIGGWLSTSLCHVLWAICKKFLTVSKGFCYCYGDALDRWSTVWECYYHSVVIRFILKKKKKKVYVGVNYQSNVHKCQHARHPYMPHWNCEQKQSLKMKQGRPEHKQGFSEFGQRAVQYLRVNTKTPALKQKENTVLIKDDTPIVTLMLPFEQIQMSQLNSISLDWVDSFLYKRC